jgi:hypothetical protein
MTDPTPSLTSQRRHLLPRTPSDRLVVALLLVGLGLAAALRVDPLIGLVPAGFAALVQKINGHVQAWRGGGIERAFVMESSAISFYMLTATFLAVGALQGAKVIGHFNAVWWFNIALFVDTTVRSSRESRFV